MKVIFAGTPDIAVPTVQALHDSSHEVVAVLTRPPARRGRGRSLHPSHIAQWARQHDVPVIEAANLSEPDTVQAIAECGADLGVVVAYGALIPPSVLDMLPHGWINLHFSKLPRWRGAAPVQRAIEAGDTSTAIDVFQLEAGLDTGPIFSSQTVEIDPFITGGELLDTLAHQGAPEVVNVVTQIEAGTAICQPQSTAGMTYARMISSRDLEIDFRASATDVHNLVRAWSPKPGAWTRLPNGQRMKILNTEVGNRQDLNPGELVITRDQVIVGTAAGSVILKTVAPAGKSHMAANDWARGARLEPSTILGSESVISDAQ
ncbi:MAG: methionyl-tRNA formyltransferase [Actinomycetaceae bacterium]|nr:methionyl-tRNA formyltransferase [Actinomycetaceae bacterium]